MKRIGFYSLVRYIDDLDRGETINVGTLLEVEGHIYRKFVDRDALNGEREVVHRFDAVLEDLLSRDELVDSEGTPAKGLAALGQRRFPKFAITEPRQIVVSEDPMVLLDRLSERLVAEHPVPARASW
jgi:hypothetical protein